MAPNNSQHPTQLLTWNENGLLEHEEDFKILNTFRPQVIAVQKTSQTLTIHNHTRIQYLQLYYKHHLGPARSNNDSSVMPSPFLLVTTHLQMLAVTIYTTRNIIIGYMYLPPGKPFSSDDLLLFYLIGQRKLLSGDFNAYHSAWGSSKSNSNGRHLSHLLSS